MGSLVLSLLRLRSHKCLSDVFAFFAVSSEYILQMNVIITATFALNNNTNTIKQKTGYSCGI